MVIGCGPPQVEQPSKAHGDANAESDVATGDIMQLDRHNDMPDTEVESELALCTALVE